MVNADLRSCCLRLCTLGSSLVTADELVKGLREEPASAHLVAVHILKSGALRLMPCVESVPGFDGCAILDALDQNRSVALVGGAIGAFGEGLPAKSFRWLLGHGDPSSEMVRIMARVFNEERDAAGISMLARNSVTGPRAVAQLAIIEHIASNMDRFQALTSHIHADVLLFESARRGATALISHIVDQQRGELTREGIERALAEVTGRPWKTSSSSIHTLLAKAMQSAIHQEQIRKSCTEGPVLLAP